MEFGIHAASMAGSWMCLVYCFSGMRIFEGRLSFRTILPQGWQVYLSRVNIKGKVIEVQVNQNRASFHPLKGNR
jgi:trehalose/maltose hydrolase-like predicted phosphorylase